MEPTTRRNYRLLRSLILLAVWAFITFVAIQHQRLGGGPSGAPPVDALCPFGGVETLYKLAAGGEFIKRTFPSSIVLLIGTLLTALVLRRAFCGWVCPLGAMQEIFGSLGRRLRLRLKPQRGPVDHGARYLKYVVLVVVVALTWKTGELVFRHYDPWAAWAHLSAGWASVTDEFLVGLIALVVTVVGSVVLERTWCRYLCPLGGLLGMVSKAGATRVVRNTATCIHCQRCDHACPVDVPVEAVAEVRSGECLTCGQCVAACPVPATLEMKTGRRPVSLIAVGLLAVALFFGPVLLAKSLGRWQSKPASLGRILTTAGRPDPANIRGFMTVTQVATAFGVSADQILATAGLPADTPRDKPLKQILPALGRSEDDVREAVKALLPTAPAAGPPAAAAPPAAAPRSPEDISGMATFAGVEKDFGVPAGKLISALGLPADTPRDQPLRDIMRPLGRHVTEVRELVAKYQQRQQAQP
jgi:NapH/MauN family ferredoxin-type protein